MEQIKEKFEKRKPWGVLKSPYGVTEVGQERVKVHQRFAFLERMCVLVCAGKRQKFGDENEVMTIEE